jgi:hypothetical protein
MWRFGGTERLKGPVFPKEVSFPGKKSEIRKLYKFSSLVKSLQIQHIQSKVRDCYYAPWTSENHHRMNYSDWFGSWYLNNEPFYGISWPNQWCLSGKRRTYWFQQLSETSFWFWINETGSLLVHTLLGIYPILTKQAYQDQSRLPLLVLSFCQNQSEEQTKRWTWHPCGSFEEFTEILNGDCF